MSPAGPNSPIEGGLPEFIRWSTMFLWAPPRTRIAGRGLERHLQATAPMAHATLADLRHYRVPYAEQRMVLPVVTFDASGLLLIRGRADRRTAALDELARWRERGIAAHGIVMPSREGVSRAILSPSFGFSDVVREVRFFMLRDNTPLTTLPHERVRLVAERAHEDALDDARAAVSAVLRSATLVPNSDDLRDLAGSYVQRLATEGLTPAIRRSILLGYYARRRIEARWANGGG